MLLLRPWPTSGAAKPSASGEALSAEAIVYIRFVFAIGCSDNSSIFHGSNNSMAGYSGIFPCFLGGFLSRLVSSISSA